MRTNLAIRGLTSAVVMTLATSLAGCGDEPEPQAEPANDVSSSQATERSTKPAKERPAGATLDVTVNGGNVSPMGRTIEMATGDVLTVRITADRAGELHVHSSPEQMVEFGQGRTRQGVKIDKPGQVDVEEHDSGALVARLLVK
jgi:predicted small lipoprotein YifL